MLGPSGAERFGHFGYQRWGCEMALRFPVTSLANYRDRYEELDASSNPFAVVTQAHLKAHQTAGRQDARYRSKLLLIRSLYRRGYQRADILELLRFIDWVLTLPEGLEDQLWAEVQQFDEEKHMRYVSSFGRIFSRGGMEKGMVRGVEKGLAKGIAEGIEQGVEQGMAIGIGKGQADLLRLLIQQRFGTLPEDLDARLEGANPEQLQAWGLRVLDAPASRQCSGHAPGTDGQPRHPAWLGSHFGPRRGTSRVGYAVQGA